MGSSFFAQRSRRLREDGISTGKGQAKIPALRELVGQLPTYWVLQEEPGGMDEAGHQAAFDRRVEEAAITATPLEATETQKSDAVYGLYRYAMDLIPNQGVDAQADVEGCRDL